MSSAGPQSDDEGDDEGTVSPANNNTEDVDDDEGDEPVVVDAPSTPPASANMTVCDPAYTHWARVEDLDEEEQDRVKAKYASAQAPPNDDEQRDALCRYASELRKKPPAWKCVARPLTHAEEESLTKLRDQINKERAELTTSYDRAELNSYLRMVVEEMNRQNTTGDVLGIEDSLKRDEDQRTLMDVILNNMDLGDLSERLHKEVYAAIAREALSTQPVGLFELAKELHQDPAKMCNEYADFMNEERRIILQTIERANEDAAQRSTGGSESTPATKKDLDARAAKDVLQECADLFDVDDGGSDLRVVHASLAIANENGDPLESTNANRQNPARGKGTTTFPNDTDPEKPVPSEKDEADNRAWVHGKGMGSKPEKQQRARGEKVAIQENVPHGNDCNPCTKWPFPNYGELGFFTAARRMMELKHEIYRTNQASWQYTASFVRDPLIAVKQSGVIGRNKEVVGFKRTVNHDLATQLIYSFDPSFLKSKDNTFTTNMLATDMLRCYPKNMKTDADAVEELNKCLDFTQWWFNNITTPPPVADNGAASKPNDVKEAQNARIYQALCAPDLTTKFGGGDVVRVLNIMRADLHKKITSGLNVFLETLYRAINSDVYKLGKKGVLFNGGFRTRSEEMKADKTRKEPHDEWLVGKITTIPEWGAPSDGDIAEGQALYNKWHSLNGTTPPP